MKRLGLISAVMILIMACSSLPGDLTGAGSSSSGAAASTAGTITSGTNVSAAGSVGADSTGGSASGSNSAPASGPFGAFPYLPDPSMSPGDTLDVTSSDICVSGYSSKVRNVPQSEKDQVYAEYGITSHAPGSYEIDHLISLELGGSNSIKNLWPESYKGDWNAHLKDKLENKLHSLVCSGGVDLKTAQHEIATNWIAAYKKYIGQP